MNQDGSLVCIPSCSAGAFYNPSTLECVCPGNSYYEKGRCVQCKGSSQWDPSRKECVCLPDSKKDANGECQPCSPYARLDSVKNECVCLPGFQGDGNVCQRSVLLWLLILLPHHQRSDGQQRIPQRLLLLARTPLYLGRRCWDSMVVHIGSVHPNQQSHKNEGQYGQQPDKRDEPASFSTAQCFHKHGRSLVGDCCN